MTWFETLTGFPEDHPQQVRANITVDGQTLTSHANGKVLVYGQLETPTLAELRERVRASGHESGKISVSEVVANVQHLHTNVSIFPMFIWHLGGISKKSPKIRLWLIMENPTIMTFSSGPAVWKRTICRKKVVFL